MRESDMDFYSVDVGNRLRELRQERNLSMRAVARASGLSTNALSMIERGRASPSVSTLYKIADALDIPITTFFREEPAQHEIVVCKAGQRKRVNLHQGIWEGLGGESFNGRMEPFMVNLDPGSDSGPYGMLHTGSEFVFCVSGEVEYTIEDQTYLLETGDSLIFAAHLRHKWGNHTDEPAQILIVLANYEAGERPSEFHLSSGGRSSSDTELSAEEEDGPED